MSRIWGHWIHWLDAEGIDGSATLGDMLAEALDVLIETMYPRAKKICGQIASLAAVPTEERWERGAANNSIWVFPGDSRNQRP